jgi:hypothetical protein
MSALGQKPTLKRFRPMSDLPPKADIVRHDRHVRFVPKADIGRRGWVRVSTAYRVVRTRRQRRMTEAKSVSLRAVVKPRVHLAVRLPRPHMTHDDEWRVRQEH